MLRSGLCGVYAVVCSPELYSIEKAHLCGFSSTHNVSHCHQCAGVKLARTLLGGVQYCSKQCSQLG